MALIKVETDLINQRRKMEGVHFNLCPRHPSADYRLVSDQTSDGGK